MPPVSHLRLCKTPSSAKDRHMGLALPRPAGLGAGSESVMPLAEQEEGGSGITEGSCAPNWRVDAPVTCVALLASFEVMV